MLNFGLIAEGTTDQVVLDNILIGYFDDINGDEIQVNFIQPNSDETDNFGGWYNVLEYCKSDIFKAGLNADLNDYYIIQIDTDMPVCEKLKISMIGENQIEELPQFVETIKTKIIADYIGLETYEAFKNQIIFAIVVHEIECWLLPLYYKNNKQGKILGCLNTLNQALAKSNKRLLIAPKNKSPKKYDKISRPFLKHKILQDEYDKNGSLKIFVKDLEAEFRKF